jgi:hypothetical protein
VNFRAACQRFRRLRILLNQCQSVGFGCHLSIFCSEQVARELWQERSALALMFVGEYRRIGIQSDSAEIDFQVHPNLSLQIYFDI